MSASQHNDDTHNEDAELVARMQRGDDQAIEMLYLRYYPALLRFAGSLVRSYDLAEEIVQETFLTLWARRQDIGIRGHVRAYLYAAVRNRALQLLQHQQVVQRTEAEILREDSVIAVARGPTGADTIVEANELAARVMRVIAAMPERRRVALILRWRHQLSHAEIAEIMGTTVGAVTTQISRARDTIEALVAAYKKGLP
jgi:RNA polymerase sigma-70 factor (ECF subfamily)